MKASNGEKASLGYHDHYVVDGGKARIILAALVTPASIMDNTSMLDLERWVRFRWQLHPDIAVGDTKYGTIANIVGLEQDGIRAYLPTADFSQRYSFSGSNMTQNVIYSFILKTTNCLSISAVTVSKSLSTVLPNPKSVILVQ